MLRRQKGVSVITKLSITQSLAVFVCMCVFAYSVASRLTSVYLQRSVEDLKTQVQTIVEMVSVYDSSLTQTAGKLSQVFASGYPKGFKLDASATVRVGDATTPTLKSGDDVINLNFTAVDSFSAITGAVATVFVRTGDDFVRVTTSLKKEDGSRAVGTRLDRAHPGYAKLMQGKEYVGKARLFGRDYMTKYVPVAGGDGQVAAVLFIGLDFTEGLRSLSEKIKGLKIGTSGYVYVVDTKEGKTQGTLVVHRSEEGKSVLESKDASGREFIKEMLQSKSGAISYRWKDEQASEKEALDRVAVYSSYPEWNWLITCTVPEAELLRETKVVRNSIILAGVVMVSLMLVILRFCSSRWISRPLKATLGLATRVSEGDLSQRLELRQADEFGQLAGAMNRMVDDMRELMGQIAGASGELASTAEELSSATTQIAASNAEVSAQAQGAASASEEMSATVETVAKNTGVVNAAAEEARQVALDGAQVVSQAVGAFGEITEVVEHAAVTVAALGEQSQKVGGVVEVIEDIADQTNLLALNAAIEAARAGEHGRGFAVVADEVRKLAEKTVKATQEISETIAATQAESRQAVEAMNRGQQMVRRGTDLGEKAGEAIQTIQAQVLQASDQTRQTATATSQLASTIREMAVKMDQIARGVEQNSSAVDEIVSTVDSLAKKADELKELTARFHL